MIEETPMLANQAFGKQWAMYHGDCVELVRGLPDNSVGLVVTSPPFPTLYTFSASRRDMGNVRDIDEMIAQYRFLIGEEGLLRAVMPGRHCVIHLNQVLAFKHRDGFIGLKDFRGRVILAMEEAGWVYYGETVIEKDPQLKAIRTKDRGLLFKTLANDASHMHMALADYLLQFRKPGDNPTPIRAGISTKYGNPGGWITNEEWIEWASGVWHRYTAETGKGIREVNVLNVSQARETDDERHLCALQLDVIERCVKLWSNPGDLVFDPFGGIGSVGYVALQQKRRFCGFELKESYWATACRYLHRAEQQSSHPTLFSALEDEEEGDEERQQLIAQSDAEQKESERLAAIHAAKPYEDEEEESSDE